METLKSLHKNEMLESKIEIQEQTFQNISREIHDNIGQKLTLAKLHLNTLSITNNNMIVQKVNDAVNMIGESIIDLSDISRSLSSEIILNNGLIKALEFETTQLQKSGLFSIELSVTGNCIFLDSRKELILFRIVQEALNNIIKHAEATRISIKLDYNNGLLTLAITDNGKGFRIDKNNDQGTGLINMKKRANMLNGKITIESQPDNGTNLKIEIPIDEQHTDL